MNSLIQIQQTILTRILRDFGNQYGETWNLFWAEDISKPELMELLVLLDEEFAQRIIKAME